MTTVRESWTDERLDDLSHRVDEGFRDVRAELRAEIGSVRTEIGSVREEVGSVRTEVGSVRTEIGSVRAEMALRSETNRGFELIHARLDGIQRAMLYGFVSLSTATLAGMLAIATQL